MTKKRRLAVAMFLCTFFAIMTFNTFGVEAIHTQQRNAEVSSVNDETQSSVSYYFTNSSFIIESVSQYGNFSFTFEWENTGTYIIYNGTRRPIRNLKSIAFTDKTAKYRMEYWVPIMLYEYIDVDGNNLFNDTVPTVPDILVSEYKIYENIGASNISIEDSGNFLIGEPFRWSYTQLALPMKSNVQEPWERFPTVRENFYYYAMNGTLKMDIVLENFKSENSSSRIFISYGVRYVSLDPGNVTVTVAFDDQELVYDQIDSGYPATSNLVVFKVNGVERGFFDFRGKVTIDNNPNMYTNGSVGPTRSFYYYQTNGKWLEIGLNYPHVNHTLIHDPYFGLYPRGSSLIAITFPFEWTVATAVISVIICTVAIVDYFRTKSRYLKPTVRPLT